MYRRVEVTESAGRREPASLIAGAVIALVLVVTALDVIVRGTAVGPDSISYLSMAQGLRRLAPAHWSGSPPGLWPYGYPAVLALMGGRARTIIEWGPVVQLAALIGVATYLVLIARQLAARHPSHAYLIGAAAFLASPAVLFGAEWLSSELCFTFIALAVAYHVILRSLLDRDAPQRFDVLVGAVASFVLPHVRFIGVAVPLGLAAGAVVLLFRADPDRHLLTRRAAVPIVGGFAGFATALLVNLSTAHTLMGDRGSPVHIMNWTVLHSVATFWQVLVGDHRLPLFRYEVVAGLAVAAVLVVLTMLTVRVAWRHGDDAYRRFTIWSLTGVGAYLLILYATALTSLLDAISPRLVLPVLPITVMWLVDSYVVASGTGWKTDAYRLDRLAGWLVVALWLGSFLYSVGANLAHPSGNRAGDLAAVTLGSSDRACLARIEDAPVNARISNNAALVWLGTDERVMAKQATYERTSPATFYFIDLGSFAAGGEIPAAVLSDTMSTVVCSGEHVVVQLRTRPGAQPRPS